MVYDESARTYISTLALGFSQMIIFIFSIVLRKKKKKTVFKQLRKGGKGEHDGKPYDSFCAKSLYF